MTNVYAIRTGDRVTGTYYGAPFRGTVIEARPHSFNDDMVFHVELDEPLTLYGLTRDSIAMTVNNWPRNECTITKEAA